jgi:hypothetical protein
VTDEPAAADEHVIDVIADELGLARAQLDAGLPGLAEGTVRRRLARLEADGGDGAADEVDALNLLLAETLWRQQRHVAARSALEVIRSGSAQRRLPIALLIDAETLAAAGEADRAAGAQERLIAAVGVDEAHVLRAGVPGRLSWPLPADLAAEAPPPSRPPWSSVTPAAAAPAAGTLSDEAAALARARMEEARVAYVAGDRGRGDGQMSIALRLDPGLAADGVRIIEPTMGRQPASERLLLYGDLLRAAGRESEAQRAYERAAERRG